MLESCCLLSGWPHSELSDRSDSKHGDSEFVGMSYLRVLVPQLALQSLLLHLRTPSRMHIIHLTRLSHPKRATTLRQVLTPLLLSSKYIFNKYAKIIKKVSTSAE